MRSPAYARRSAFSEPEPLAILEGRDSHVTAELEGEGTLVVEAEVDGDFANLGALLAEFVAGGLPVACEQQRNLPVARLAAKIIGNP